MCVLDHLIHLYGKRQFSKYEMQFIVYISQYQDNSGRVQGIYYKDICKALKISFQKLYLSICIRKMIKKESKMEQQWQGCKGHLS